MHKLAVKAAEADYKSLQATLQSTLMDKKTAAAQVNADYTQDQLQAQTDKALCDLGVICRNCLREIARARPTNWQLSTSSASSNSM